MSCDGRAPDAGSPARLPIDGYRCRRAPGSGHCRPRRGRALGTGCGGGPSDSRYDRHRRSPNPRHAARRRTRRPDGRRIRPTARRSPRRYVRRVCGLLDDLVAIRTATVTLPTPPRVDDYQLTPEDAARLRPGGWRRLVAAIGSSRAAFTRPLGVGLTTLGLAGLLVATVPSVLTGTTALGPTAGAASVPESNQGAEDSSVAEPQARPGSAPPVQRRPTPAQRSRDSAVGLRAACLRRPDAGPSRGANEWGCGRIRCGSRGRGRHPQRRSHPQRPGPPRLGGRQRRRVGGPGLRRRSVLAATNVPSGRTGGDDPGASRRRRRERAVAVTRASPLRSRTRCRRRRSQQPKARRSTNSVPRMAGRQPWFSCRLRSWSPVSASSSSSGSVGARSSRGFAVRADWPSTKPPSARGAGSRSVSARRLLLTAGRQKSGWGRSARTFRYLARHLVDCWSHLRTRGATVRPEGRRGTLSASDPP